MAIEAACTSIVSPYLYDEYVVCGDKRKALGLVYVVCGIDNVLPLYQGDAEDRKRKLAGESVSAEG